ncbi:YdgA family protein [Orrella sp. NBD-18]|uniref:YdgA family protein n=1 Tax=Sheuella amnicola TaxID=2707330 RepID=A0A6B2QUE7_9BURK|nr:DUF945 family protein [Sheuella amnicola]NDY81950.1 YdgA family protein [Sheuella amnicola]HBI84547.1 hypothetical protein [Alcaligenaceae bacterium]
MKLKNFAISLGALIAIAVCVWLGSSIYIGRTTSQRIETLISKQLNPNASIRIVDHKHEQSLFSSKGQFEIRFNDIPVDADTGKQFFAVAFNYQVNNLLLPESVMRFEWMAKPTGEAGKEIDRLFSKEINLNGKGKLGYGGKALSSLKMPELVMNQGSDKLLITPSNGHISWKEKSLNFDWKTDRISLVTDGYSYDVEGIQFMTDIQNRQRGLGMAEFSVNKASSKDFTFTGYKFKTLSTERGDRLDFTINQKLDSISAASEKISNVVMDFSMTDLDATSVEQLTDILDSASDRIQSWTDDDKQRAKKALATMIGKGFKISIPKIYAEYGKGSIDGSVQLDVLKSDSNQNAFDFSKSVRASGQILGNGKLLDQSQKAMVVMMGIAKDTKEGLKASFEFSGNKLVINGKSQDVTDSVSMLNETVNELLYK